MTAPTSPHARLRTATAAAHEQVDAAFAGFDLGDRAGYTAFLTAHARALPAVEIALAEAGDLPDFRPRAAALAQDLAELDADRPALLPFATPDTSAGRWGALYVIEGSRLGGGLLARSVPPGWPRAYLSAIHEPGEWRTFLARYDAAVADAAWEDEALAAARDTFTLYARAAELGTDRRA